VNSSQEKRIRHTDRRGEVLGRASTASHRKKPVLLRGKKRENWGMASSAHSTQRGKKKRELRMPLLVNIRTDRTRRAEWLQGEKRKPGKG